MADPLTTNILLAIPTPGTDSGTWGTPINGDFNILDACFGSINFATLSNADVTLSTSQSQVSILNFNGSLTGSVTITLGAVIKSWMCYNQCLGLGSFVITVQGSTASGNVVCLPPGWCQVAWDGLNMNYVNLGVVGQIVGYPAAAVPQWVAAASNSPYLNCNGSSFSGSTYPLLAQIIPSLVLPNLPLSGGINMIRAA